VTPVPAKICPRCHARFAESALRCTSDGWRLIADRTGQLIAGRYLIEQFVGAGGGGASVWRASLLGNDGKLALKLLHETDETGAQRFERGARLALELEHPSIATVHEFGHFNDVMYIAMDLLEGESIQDVLQRDRVIPWATAITWIDQVLAALEVAHERGIVHRDLKPANLFLTDDPSAPGGRRVRILDFGIARTVEGQREALAPQLEDEDDDIIGREITARHHICGTPEYMAPEQILGAAPQPTMDIYGVGVALYRMLTGRMPFKGKTRFDIYHGHLTAHVPPLEQSLVPEPLAQVVLGALAKKPEERHTSARAFREALRFGSEAQLPTLDGAWAPTAHNPLPRPNTPMQHVAVEGDPDTMTLQDVSAGGLRDAAASERHFAALVGLGEGHPASRASARPNTRKRLGVTLALVGTIVAGAVIALWFLGR
jgi:serine/threonine protein kinase